ncbi:hypothetical protein M9H77_27203 [Catharanthus roseus]|uniref:Uncharacterized protein n=1 Tax=Catharanthus roseus TaxID=4058 RepID=A0ACC0ADG2_CATRO|nr:hypothetical protein M9H77_27203 [Catharanthus roseus]
MKNKFFKRIRYEKQCKHGKGSNKIDKTHNFDSYGNSICTTGPPSIPETLDPILEGFDEEVEYPEAQAQVLRVRRGSDHHVTYWRCLDTVCTTHPLLGVLSFLVRHNSGRRSLSAAARKVV